MKTTKFLTAYSDEKHGLPLWSSSIKCASHRRLFSSQPSGQARNLLMLQDQMNPDAPFFSNWWKPICCVQRRVRACRVSSVPQDLAVSSSFIRMQGGTPASSTGPEEQRQHGNWSRAMSPSVSPLFQNKIPTIYSRTYCVLVFHTKKQETSEGKRGPSFLHGGPRRLGSLRVLAGG